MEQFLLLRRVRTETPGLTLSVRGQRGEYSAEVRMLDDQSAAQLAREDDVDLLTRAMPLRLIAPVSGATSETATDTGDTTWGIQAIAANRSDYDGSGVVVAVLDTGIDRNHECFKGVELVERDFTGAGVYDTDGHGTHCAGTIFGRSKSAPRIGVAPGVSKALIGKVIGGTDGGSSATLKGAIEWAIDNGAHVISMSLGIDFPGYVDALVAKKDWPIDFATSVALRDYRFTIRFFDHFSDLIRASAEAPLIVAAAGNESRRPQYPLDVAPPAAANHLLSVAAIRKEPDGYGIAEFSNANALLAAPGVNVLSARAGGGYVSMSGTSMATPHVAGAAALWAQYLCHFGPDELRSRVHGTARRFGLKRTDVGAGVVQAPTSVNS